MKPVRIKAELLANGIRISDKALSNFGLPFLEKRRAYGNPDPNDMRNYRIPQELYILPDKLVVAVNVDYNSPWLLDFVDENFSITNGDIQLNVTFPLRPQFYDQTLLDGTKVSKIITLYGGGSLGLFINGSCYFANLGKPCHYCSIKPNRSKVNEFVSTISAEIALESIEIGQVMINGGNFNNFDKNFLYYSNVVKYISETIHSSKRDVDLHLITFPPENTNLFSELVDTDVSVAINTEIYDEKLFSKYSPGKQAFFGRERLLKSIETASSVLGAGRVYSIFVGGLESIESLRQGMVFLSELGVTPVINVLHTDPETPLENHKRPSADFIMEMGGVLQEIYSKYNFTPFYNNCGRNSIDTEAYNKLF